VIAEGSRTATLDLLRQLGCDIAQGYHLGRPVKFQDLLSWCSLPGHPGQRKFFPLASGLQTVNISGVGSVSDSHVFWERNHGKAAEEARQPWRVG
jgi:hypothetical protein